MMNDYWLIEKAGRRGKERPLLNGVRGVGGGNDRKKKTRNTENEINNKQKERARPVSTATRLADGDGR